MLVIKFYSAYLLLIRKRWFGLSI